MAHIITSADPTGVEGADLVVITVAQPATMHDAAEMLAASDTAAWWLDTDDGSVIANKHVARATVTKRAANIVVAKARRVSERPRRQRNGDMVCKCRMCASGNEGLCPYGNG